MWSVAAHAPSDRHRALGYIRVSSYIGRDRGEGLTEDLQLEKIQQWCAVADLKLVDVLRDVDKVGQGLRRSRAAGFR